MFTLFNANYAYCKDLTNIYNKHKLQNIISEGEQFIATSIFSERNGVVPLTLKPIISDFKVNEDKGSAWQSYSCVATKPDGSFIIVWEDWRAGDSDIMFQNFDSNGNPLGNSIKVNDDFTSTNQTRPFTRSAKDGSFIITWTDERNGDMSIYLQRYDMNGNPIGRNIKVDDDIAKTKQNQPSLGIANDGSFVVAWEDKRNCYIGHDYDIYFQRYDKNGVPIGPNVNAIDNEEGVIKHYQGRPSIDVAPDGKFAIVWVDERNNYKYDIYFQYFDSNGNPISKNTIVNDDPIDDRNRDQDYPFLEMANDGSFIVGWNDCRTDTADNSQDIYIQRFDNIGNKIGTNIKVNDDVSTFRPFVNISIANDKRFIVVWEDLRNDTSRVDFDIYYQLFDSLANPIGSNVKVNDDMQSAIQGRPFADFRSDKSFIISWTDSRDYNVDIYFQIYDPFASPINGNIRLGNDIGSSQQWYTDITANDSGFIVVWEDFRAGSLDEKSRFAKGDIFLQRYKHNGTPIGVNTLVNTDFDPLGKNDQFEPAISSNNGRFAVVWTDTRNHSKHDYYWGGTIYLQIYNQDGTIVKDNILVSEIINDPIYTVLPHRFPAVTVMKDSSIVVVWSDKRNGVFDVTEGNWDIYMQRFNKNGDKLGPNVKVDDDTTTYIRTPPYRKNAEQMLPQIGSADDGSFIIVWQDNRNFHYDIYYRKYNNLGQPITKGIKVNTDQTNTDQISPAIAVAKDGSFIIGWIDLRNGYADIYYQRYNSFGERIGDNTKVSELSGFIPYTHTDAWISHPHISMDSDRSFIITWTDDRRGYDSDIYAQRYDARGNPIGWNFKITDEASLYNQKGISTALLNGKIYNAWIDDKIEGMGGDVWVNVLSFSMPLGYVGRLTGTVTDAGSETPIEGVLVTCNPLGFKDTTDVYGYFCIEVTADTLYELEFSAEGYQTTTYSSISVNLNVTAKLKQTLTPPAPKYSPFVFEPIAKDKAVDIYFRPTLEKNVVGYQVFRRTKSIPYNWFNPINEKLITGSFFQDNTVIPETTYYYVMRAVNGYGYMSPLSNEVSATPTLNSSPPTSPDGLTISYMDSSSIKLTWQSSSDLDVAKYYVYWDNGTGIIDYSTPLGTVYANDSLSYVVNGLTPDKSYRFAVRCEDSTSHKDNNKWEISAGTTKSKDTLKMIISTPECGKIVYGQNTIIEAKPILNADKLTNYVLFQYRKVGTNDWIDFISKDVNLPNPSVDAPFRIVVDISDTLLFTNGLYELRAISITERGFIDYNPATITVEINKNYANVLQRLNSAFEYEEIVNVSRNKENNIISIRLAKKTDEVAPPIDAMKVILPKNAISEDTQLKITCVADDRNSNIISLNPYPYIPNSLYKIELMNKETQLSNGMVIYLPYNDTNKDGIVDGTNAPVDSLLTFYNNGTGWFPIPSTVQSSKSRVRLVTGHLTLFGLFAKCSPCVSANEEENMRNITLPFNLSQNYPNPFNTTTTVRYQVSSIKYPSTNSDLQYVSLKIYSITGELVRTLVDEKQSPGYYSVVWNGLDDNGKSVPSGIYIYKVDIFPINQNKNSAYSLFSKTMKAVLIK